MPHPTVAATSGRCCSSSTPMCSVTTTCCTCTPRSPTTSEDTATIGDATRLDPSPVPLPSARPYSACSRPTRTWAWCTRLRSGSSPTGCVTGWATDASARRYSLVRRHAPAHGWVDYPVGGMFWARVDALRPLFEAGLTADDFEAEPAGHDGTLAHAVDGSSTSRPAPGVSHRGVRPRVGAVARQLVVAQHAEARGPATR